MHQGNWKCSTCGGAITELPFEPKGVSGLTCRACYGKQKDKERGGGGGGEGGESIPEVNVAVATEPQDDIPDFAEVAGEAPPHEDFAPDMVPSTPEEKPKYSGDWKCAGCEAPISSLPFQPRDVTSLKCLDCFKKSKS
jgi:CxxC-x17-CxxC domain-containing protein